MPITSTAFYWDTKTLFPDLSLPSLLQDECRYCICRSEMVRKPPLGPHCQQQATIHTMSEAKYYFSLSTILSTRSKQSCPMDAVNGHGRAAAFCLSQSRALRTVLDPAAAPRKGLMSGCLSNSRSTVFRDESLKRLLDFINFCTVEKLKDWIENGSQCAYSLDGWPTVLGAAWKDYGGQNIHQQMCFDHLQHPLEGCYSNNSLSPLLLQSFSSREQILCCQSHS